MEHKAKINLLMACGGVIIGGLLGGGGVWLWQKSQTNCAPEKANVAELQRKVSQLEADQQVSQPTDPAKPGTGSGGGEAPPNATGSAPKPTGLMVSDQDYLKIMTLNAVKDSTVGDFWAPLMPHYINGEWAETSPLPIKFNQEQGYHVPATGGLVFFWHKKDGKWLKFGTCTESGCEYIPGYKEADIPISLRRQ